MKLLIIRHADPDYSIDSLTETGWKEAEALSEKLKSVDIKDIYVSPLGRAKDTASLTLKKLGKDATVCEWLQEFPGNIIRPDYKDGKIVPWDWLPKDIDKNKDLLDINHWFENETYREGNIHEGYMHVAEELDKLLAKHGYVREGTYYRVEKANNDTIAFFCHFGLECVLLSHLVNIAPSALWQGFCAAPSSVTTIYTEERRKGIASFRIAEFGSTEHLYVNGYKPSFSARFCECYDNKDERHD